PLASIKLYLQTILKRDLDRTKQQTFLMNSLKDIERLDDLVENVLLVTKLEGKGFSLPKEELNFTELIREIAGRLQMFSCDSQVIRTDLVEDAYLLADRFRSEEHTSELQSRFDLVCRLLLEKKKT